MFVIQVRAYFKLTLMVDVIRYETEEGGNTKERIADMFQAIINSCSASLAITLVAIICIVLRMIEDWEESHGKSKRR